MEIRQATLEDIEHIKQIASKHTKELGFILRPALVEAVNRRELLYHPLSGSFCHYHRRKDNVNVIYEICVPVEFRGQGIAKSLIDYIPLPIILKCPIDNESNMFYLHIGFDLLKVEPGKKRKLNVWYLKDKERLF